MANFYTFYILMMLYFVQLVEVACRISLQEHVTEMRIKKYNKRLHLFLTKLFESLLLQIFFLIVIHLASIFSYIFDIFGIQGRVLIFTTKGNVFLLTILYFRIFSLPEGCELFLIMLMKCW